MMLKTAATTTGLTNNSANTGDVYSGQASEENHQQEKNNYDNLTKLQTGIPPSLFTDHVGEHVVSISNAKRTDITRNNDNLNLLDGNVDDEDESLLLDDEYNLQIHDKKLSKILRRIKRLKLAKQLLQAQYDVGTFMLCGRDANLSNIKSLGAKAMANVTLVFGTFLLSIYVACLTFQVGV